MARAHLREQVYGLSDLAESNDLDSDIASLADWLRLGAHGTHRQQGSTGPGGLNLKVETRFKAVPAQGLRLTSWPAWWARPAQLQPASDLQSYIYHMILVHAISINAGGVAVRAALRCVWDPWFESRHYAFFCKMFYTRIFAYILTCTQIHSVYTHIYGLAAVFMCSYECIQSHTCIKLYVCWYTQYILICTEYSCCLLSASQLSQPFWETLEQPWRRKI